MKIKQLVAACAMSLTSEPNRLVIVPEGEFHGIDGRPFDAPCWRLTQQRGEQIVAALSSRQIDLVIDYEHGTLKAAQTGEPAPASGWLKPSGWEYVPGVGICNSQFEWTDKAKSFIASGEYKYLSPVLLYNKEGEVLNVLSVALTNTPNLDELPEALLAAAAQDYLSATLKESSMDELLEQLRWMLNLPLSATAEEILAELSKLQTQIKEKTGVAIAANGQNLYDLVNAAQLIQGSTLQELEPDPTQWVPMAVHQEALAQAATVAANNQAKELDDLIVAACSDGRLTGTATINWVKDQAAKNPEAAKAYIEGLPKIAALTQQQSQQTNIAANQQQQDGQYTPEDLAVAAAMGVELPGANA